MPTDFDAAEFAADTAPPPTTSDTRKGLRLALGTGGLFIIGMALAWPFAFVGAVLAALILQGDAAPSARAGLRLVLTAVALLLFGFALFSLLLPYPSVFVIAQILMLGWAFSFSVSGRSPLLVVLALMGALMMPYVARQSLDLALAMAIWLPLNMVFALLASWSAFGLFPAQRVGPAAQPTAAGESFDPERRLVRMMFVALPFVALFTLLDSGAVLTLLFVAILTQQLAASTGAGPMVAKNMLAANVAGGLAAILAFELVVMDRSFGFMAVASLVLCLGFARWFVSDHPLAPLAGSALTTALILLGGAMAPYAEGTDVKMLTRLLQVSAALLWVLAAFVVVDRFLPEREARSAAPDWRRGRHVRAKAKA